MTTERGQGMVYFWNARIVQHKTIHQCNIHSRKKDENNMIISVDAEKTFHKIQHYFMIKTFNDLGIEGNHLKVIKVICGKPRIYIALKGKTQKPFPEDQKQEKDAHFYCIY